MSNIFTRGIEVATAALIKRTDGKLLLVQSPKWSNKWCLPGGHIEIGESIIDATLREIKEETNIDATYINLLQSGELIGPKDFHRPIHLIYFTSLVTTAQQEPQLDNDELIQYRWLTPIEALKLPLAEPNDQVIKKYLWYLNDNSDT